MSVILITDTISLVTDLETAKTIPPQGTSEEKTFLKFYLTKQDKKLIIPAKEYILFEKEMEEQEHLSRSLRDFMLHQFRGFITYSKEGEENSDYHDLIKLVDSHYATVQFVIVDKPEQYRSRFSVFKDEFLVTPMEFMLRIRSEPSMFSFCDEFAHLWRQFKKK